MGQESMKPNSWGPVLLLRMLTHEAGPQRELKSQKPKDIKWIKQYHHYHHHLR